jgi:DNA invertase Pin-like site-specific DNA recombinase
MRHRVLDSYARESAAGDKRNVSILSQHEVNAERIEDLDAQLGEQLDDKGKSAWKKNVARPGWERLVQRLKDGESDGAVIFDMERLLRTVEDGLKLVTAVKAAREAGRKILIYDSDGEFDLSTPSGEKAFYDAVAAAQYYSARLSSRVQRGNRKKAVRGEGRRGRYRPFGFEEDGHTVNETERPYIGEAVRRILAGGTWPEVADWLNQQGIYSTGQDHTPECLAARADLVGIKYKQYSCTCPRRPWEKTPLRGALMAPRMAGHVKLGRGELLGKLPGEPIVDPVDWQAMLALIESRRGRPPLAIYLCTGKDCPIRCGNCGGYFTVVTNSRGFTYDDGEIKRYYRCMGCGKTIADARALDRAIVAMVLARLSSPEQIDQIKHVAEQQRKKRVPHEEKIKKLEELQDYWDSRLNQEKVTPSKHAAMSDDLDKKIKAEKGKLEKIEEAPAVPADAVSIDTLSLEWRAATPAQKRERLKRAYSGFHILVTPGSSTASDVRDRVSKPTPATPGAR